MSDTRSRSGILVGLAAAVGAFGAAAMMSAATAPTARADDFTDCHQRSWTATTRTLRPDFTAALADFSSSSECCPRWSGSSSSIGVDNEWADSCTERPLGIGTVEVLTNESSRR